MRSWAQRLGTSARVALLSLGAAGPLAAADEQPSDPNAPRITFVGFSTDGSAGIVYVDITQPVSASKSETEGKVSYALPGTVIEGRNNRRALLTKFFGTPVQSVVLSPSPGGATLEITVEGKPVVSHQVVRGESGSRLKVRASAPASAPSGSP